MDAAPDVGQADTPPTNPDLPAKLDLDSTPMPSDVPGPQGADGPASPIDAETRTLYSPDGRTWTVIMVAACQSGSQPDTIGCPVTYDEGLAKVLGVDGGRALSETGAGRCLEGSYVYFPYLGTSSIGCYYDASTRRLVASALHSDTILECGQDGTASHTFASGQYPICSEVTWEARNHL